MSQPLSNRSIICYGKVPTQGDFVRVNANGDLLLAFDQWIQQGLLRDKQLGFNGHEVDVSNGSVVQFIFGAQPGTALTGVMGESRDSAGRKYPLIIAREPDEGSSDPLRVANIPVEMAGFLNHATEYLDRIRSGFASLEQLRADLSDPPTGTLQPASSRLAEMFTGLWGDFDSPSKYVTFGSLCRVLSPLRGKMPPRLSFGIRYPIRSDPGLAATDVAFWLKASAILAGDTAFQPVCFWQADVERSKSWLVAYLRPGPPVAASSLFKGGAGDEDIFDLETSMADPPDELRSAIPNEFAKLLDEEDLRLETIASRMHAIL
jgi:type VI secretion system protein ImpM